MNTVSRLKYLRVVLILKPLLPAYDHTSIFVGEMPSFGMYLKSLC